MIFCIFANFLHSLKRQRLSAENVILGDQNNIAKGRGRQPAETAGNGCARRFEFAREFVIVVE